MAKLGIHGAEYTVGGIRITLDGVEIQGVVELQLDLREGEVNRATIVFNVEEIDVTVEALAILHALIEAQKREGVEDNRARAEDSSGL